MISYFDLEGSAVIVFLINTQFEGENTSNTSYASVN